MSESWATIPSFPEYQINVEGEARYTRTKELLPILNAYGAEVYGLVKDGKSYMKTKQGLIDETNPHILRRQDSEPVKELK